MTAASPASVSLKEVFGECEEILGEIGRQIELIAMDTSLTDARAKSKAGADGR